MPQVVPAIIAIGTAVAGAVGIAAVGFTAFAIGAATIVAAGMAANKLISNLYEIPTMDTDASRQSTVKSTVEPQKIIYGETLVSGPISFVGVAGPKNRDLYHAVVLAGHEVNAITDIHFDNEVIFNSQIDGSGNVTSGRFEPVGGDTICKINKKLGGAGQTADADLVATFNAYTSNHKGTGLAYIVTKWTLTDKSQETWDKYKPQNIKALVQGRKVYDYRLDDELVKPNVNNASFIAYSTNPVWCLIDYLINTDFGMSVNPNRIDWDAAVIAADACDATVSVPSGVEKRFTCNGVLFGTDTHKTNINKLLSSMNGMLSYTNGQFVIRAGAYEAPSVSLDEDSLSGAVSVKTSVERSERFNTVTGVFIDPSQNYKSTEFPEVFTTAARTRDNGEILTKEIQLPMTNSRFMAQRIANKLVQQSDQQKVVTFPTNLSGMEVAIGDRVSLSLAEFNWSNKVFLCLGWTLSDSGNGGVNLILREDDSGSYADPAVGEYSTISATGALVEGFRGVPDPSNLSATAGLKSIELNWTNPDNMSDVLFVEVFASPNSSWANRVKIGEVNGTQFFHDGSTTADPLDIGDERYYWVRARAYSTGEDATAVSDRNPDNDTSTINATVGGVNYDDVVGDAKPEDNATVGATIGTDLKDSTDTVVGDSDVLNSNDLVTITTNDSSAPSTGEFNTATGRNPRSGDIAITTDTTATPDVTYAWKYNGTSWVSVPNLISGDLLVDGSITADQINANSIASAVITAGSIVVTGDNVSDLTNDEGFVADGDTGVGLGLTSGSLGGSAITIASDKIFQGAGTFGNANTDFFLGDNGKFSIQDKLSFDATDTVPTLVLNGELNASKITVGSGTSTAAMNSDGNVRFWAGSETPTQATPFVVQSDGEVFARNLILTDINGNEFFNAQDGFTSLALSQIASVSSGVKVTTYSEALANDNEEIEITLEQTSNITFKGKLSASFSGAGTGATQTTARNNALAEIPDNFTIMLRYGTSSGFTSSQGTLIATQTYTKSTDTTPTSVQYECEASDGFYEPELQQFFSFARVLPSQGAVGPSNYVLLSQQVTNLPAGTYYVKAFISTTDGFFNSTANKVSSSASRTVEIQDDTVDGGFIVDGGGSQTVGAADITSVTINTSGGITGGASVLAGAATFNLSLDSSIATQTYVNNQISNLVDSAPATLDTLNELSAALGDDPNFATTVSTQLGNKVDKVAGKGLSTEDYTTAEKNKLAGIAAGAQVNVGTNLGSSGTGGTRTITSSTGSNTSITYSAADVGAVPTGRTLTAGDGLSGGGNLTANRTFAVDSSVVRTSGNQSIGGLKTFISDSGANSIRVRVRAPNNDFGNYGFVDGSDNFLGSFGRSPNGLRVLNNTAVEIVSFRDNGNVGIGTTSPSERLHVVGNINATTGYKINGATVIDSSRNVYANYSFLGRGLRSPNRGELHLNATGASDVSEIFFGYGNGHTEANIRWALSDRGSTDKLIFYKGPANGGFDEVASLKAGDNSLDVAGAYKLNGTTVIDASRNLTNIGSGSFSGNVGIGTSSPLGGTNNNGLHVDRGGHSTILIGDGVNDGGVIQASDNRRRVFIGANVYDDQSNSWSRFATHGASSMEVFADNDLNFIRFNVDNSGSGYAAVRMQIEGNGNVRVVTGNLQMGTTTVIDASRNLTNIVNGRFSGNVGIGTASPSHVLHVRGSGAGSAIQAGVYSSSDRARFVLMSETNVPNDLYLGTNGAYRWSFTARNSTENYDFGLYSFNTNSYAIRVTGTNNNVGIGTTSPSERLHVVGNILASGNVTAYSDERLKDNIETLDGSKVLEMRGVSFTKDDEIGSGVIAQELEKIAPELVHTADDEMGTKSVAYGNLVGYLIEAVKLQQTQIDELKAQIEGMKNAN